MRIVQAMLIHVRSLNLCTIRGEHASWSGDPSMHIVSEQWARTKTSIHATRPWLEITNLDEVLDVEDALDVNDPEVLGEWYPPRSMCLADTHPAVLPLVHCKRVGQGHLCTCSSVDAVSQPANVRQRALSAINSCN